MKLLKPKYDLKTQQYQLDCRDMPDKLGMELFSFINESITADNLFIEKPLPSYLLLTQRQFASLNNYTDEMYGVVDRMFKSYDSHNRVQCVMQVVIDRDGVDNFEAVDDTMKLVDIWDEEMRMGKVEAPPMPNDGIIPMK